MKICQFPLTGNEIADFQLNKYSPFKNRRFYNKSLTINLLIFF